VKKTLRTLLPIVVLAAGVAVFMALKASKPTAKKTAQDDRGTVVEVMAVQAKDHAVEVIAQGRVIPARQVALAPEVAGRIKWQSAELVPGGLVKQGASLVRIDARDYELAVQQQQAAVDRAKLELDVERGRKKVAEREWKLLDDGQSSDGSAGESLALRGPQLRTAKVAVQAAQSGLARTQLAVTRTTVKAPFNAMVQSEQSELGQLVGPQTPLVNLVGTDEFWVQVSIPVDNLASIKVPGAVARVSQNVGGQSVARSGTIVRLLGDLDPTGGMARVLIEIKDPLGLIKGAPQAALPMLIGAFVEVKIAAGEIKGAMEIPRAALREGNRVFTLSDDGGFTVKPVTVAWRNADTVLVSEGLTTGERVITSRVGDAVPGMKMRTSVTDAGPETARAPKAE